MKRREFIGALGWAAVWSLASRAQQGANLPRIGLLGLGPPDVDRVQAFLSELHDLGYVEGKNVVIDYRWAEGVDQLPELAADLVRLNADVIFAVSSTEVERARRATTTIPIVFAFHGDPVGIGHVQSLARPGGNITGVTMLATDLAAKELEILTEAVPQATRIGVIWHLAASSHPPALKAVQAASEKLGIKLLMIPVQNSQDIHAAFARMARERADGFLELGSSLLRPQRALFAQLELESRLPGMFQNRETVQAGGLMSYAPHLNDLVRRAAVYVDKILKGAKPADLPVEQASKYELVINLKTAKALGLTVPPSLLARADEVIE